MSIPASTPDTTQPHRWRFFRTGGFDQVRLESGADFVNLHQLDQKLWTALACPTKGLEFDARTLELMDSDKDGRIRASELLSAVHWAVSLLKDPNDLVKGSAALPLAAINDAQPEGKRLLAAARQVLEHLGKKDATSLTAADTSDTAKVFAQTKLNGDGIVLPESTDDPAVSAVMKDVLECCGSETDRSGKPGLSQAKVDAFFAEAQAFSDWWKKAETEAATVLPLGDGTAAAAAAVRAVSVKVEDYFARCRLAAFDVRAQAALNREEKEYLALAARDLTVSSAEIAVFPLARIEPGRPLPLKEGINPAWAGAVAALVSAAVVPLLGDRPALTEADWAVVRGKLAPYEGWLASKSGAAVEKLGIARVREILGGKAREAITALIAKDKALEEEFASITNLDRLIRYHAGLKTLCINFVSFRDFYDRGEPAIFQLGTLYLDQRACTLCLPVEDAGKHAALAGLAGAYLAYCDVTRKGSGEKMQIVAAFTDGDSDNLMVGRNGVFYDRKGRDWDATITKIIDNPISLRQAFWSPYKKFVRMIEEQVAKRAAAAEASSTAKLQAAATAVTSADKAAVKAPEPKKVDVGTVAALGVAFGSIGTFLSGMAAHAMGVVAWGPVGILGAVLGVILLISGPSMLIAYLKLRKRNLGPILDANGWAVNAKAKVNVPFGASLTGMPKLPPGSQRDLVDPFAEKPSPWPWLIAGVLVLWILYAVLNSAGLVHEWTGGLVGKQKKPAVLSVEAPSTNAVPAEPAKP